MTRLALFRVCAHRGAPVIIVINKWGPAGRDALELMDEIETASPGDIVGLPNARGDQAPVLAAVWPMQFEVVAARIETEFHAPTRMDTLGRSLAQRTTTEHADTIKGFSGVEAMTTLTARRSPLFSDKWKTDSVRRPGARDATWCS